MKLSESPRVLLPKMLQDVHRGAVLAELSALGHDIETWQPDEVNEAIEQVEAVDYQRTIDRVEPRHWFEVEFDRMDHTSGHRHTKPIYAVPILGSSSLNLINTSTLAYTYDLAHRNTDDWSWTQSIDAPVRTLEVDLQSRTRRLGAIAARRQLSHKATIYMGQDLPPVAIDDRNITFSADKHTIEYDNLNVIERVVDDFGPDAVQHLDDETCASLMRAALTARTQIAALYS